MRMRAEEGKYGEEGSCPLPLSDVASGGIQARYLGYEDKVTSRTCKYKEYAMDRCQGGNQEDHASRRLCCVRFRRLYDSCLSGGILTLLCRDTRIGKPRDMDPWIVELIAYGMTAGDGEDGSCTTGPHWD